MNIRHNLETELRIPKFKRDKALVAMLVDFCCGDYDCSTQTLSVKHNGFRLHVYNCSRKRHMPLPCKGLEQISARTCG